MTRIYLIRHAEAEGNYKRICQGHTDAEVSENGLRQLDFLKERCRKYPFDAVYSSPLKRAYKTAQAADFYHHLPIATRKGLMEICVGRWEGVPWDDLPRLYPEENRLWEEKPWLFCARDGESMQAVYERIWDTIVDIVKENIGKTVCVVSHGCAIRNFLCRAEGWPIEKLGGVPWCENTGVSVVDFDSKMNTKIVYFNDASHLDEETSTIGKQDWWKRGQEGGR